MIKKHGGVFGRNPTYHDVTVENDLTVNGSLIINGETINALDYQGTWDASTNTPTLASGTGSTGEVYVVGTAGTTTLDGISNWGAGDMLIYSGSQWERIEGSADGNFVNVSSSGNATFTGSITVTGTANFNGTNNVNSDLDFADNVKANFGAGSDLQIYHDGSNSYINESGTGQLFIQGAAQVEIKSSAVDERMIVAKSQNAVELYYDNAKKLSTTSTGIDVTGTVTADGLTVDGSTTTQINGSDYTYSGTNYEVHTLIGSSGGGVRLGQDSVTHASLIGTTGHNDLDFVTYNGASWGKRARIQNNGDIYFYEDTGTTPKFFWDASAESLGIGTTTPNSTTEIVSTNAGGEAELLQIRNASTDAGTTSVLRFINSTVNDSYQNGGFIKSIRNGSDDNDLTFGTVDTEAMRIDSSGRVGIGTDDPTAPLHIDSNGTNYATLTLGDQDTSSSDTGIYLRTNSLAKFSTAPSGGFAFCTDGLNTGEKVRIDNSGNFLVGTTNSIVGVGNTDNGVSVRGSEGSFFSRSITNTASVAHFNRNSSDGVIVKFAKDGTAVGHIGTLSGNTYFAGASKGIRFRSSDGFPTTNDGSASDNTVDLGISAARWQDIYATNGTIQTSDRNEKQDIEELSEAEQRVAVACKGLLRKFRWQDAVAEKGDDARIHFGIIAQDLQDAFAAEGLDAGRYAMFISSTWWEATETYTDDDGVEQTRTNTYDTAEEAPEGATERTRLGVRYPELLAFIIAAI